MSSILQKTTVTLPLEYIRPISIYFLEIRGKGIDQMNLLVSDPHFLSQHFNLIG